MYPVLLDDLLPINWDSRFSHASLVANLSPAKSFAMNRAGTGGNHLVPGPEDYKADFPTKLLELLASHH